MMMQCSLDVAHDAISPFVGVNGTPISISPLNREHVGARYRTCPSLLR